VIRDVLRLFLFRSRFKPVSDDTAPLQNAIRAAINNRDNRILYLTAGTYNLTNTL